MDTKSIIDSALDLTPAERLLIIEALSKSLSEPNLEIDKFWKDEVEQRYTSYLEGKSKTIPYSEIT